MSFKSAVVSVVTSCARVLPHLRCDVPSASSLVAAHTIVNLSPLLHFHRNQSVSIAEDTNTAVSDTPHDRQFKDRRTYCVATREQDNQQLREQPG